MPRKKESLARIVTKIRDLRAMDSIMTHRMSFVNLKERRHYNFKQALNINVTTLSSVRSHFVFSLSQDVRPQ